MATILARTVPATTEDAWRVCDAPVVHGGTVTWCVRVLGSTGQQVLFNLYACPMHRRLVERMARERDD
jgi:hypothetical protein